MDIVWILGFFFIFCLVAFMAVAFFLPEWVGITGQKANEIQKHQAGGSSPEAAVPNETAISPNGTANPISENSPPLPKSKSKS